MRFIEAQRVVDIFNELWPSYGAEYAPDSADNPGGSVTLKRMSSNPEYFGTYRALVPELSGMSPGGALFCETHIDAGNISKIVFVSPEGPLISVMTTIVMNELAVMRGYVAPGDDSECEILRQFIGGPDNPWLAVRGFMEYLRMVGPEGRWADSNPYATRVANIALEQSFIGLNKLVEYWSTLRGAKAARKSMAELMNFLPLPNEVENSLKLRSPAWQASLPAVASVLEGMLIGYGIELSTYALPDSENDFDALGISIHRLDGSEVQLVQQSEYMYFQGSIGFDEAGKNLNMNTGLVHQSSLLEKSTAIAAIEYFHIAATLWPITENELRNSRKQPKSLVKKYEAQSKAFDAYFYSITSGAMSGIDSAAYKCALETETAIRQARINRLN